MKLTIDETLKQAIAFSKEGKIQDAERLYRAILQTQPTHPDANHNLGLLAVSAGKAGAALPLFKTAIKANPKKEQFWFSYIDALIREQKFEAAKQVVEQVKSKGMAAEKLTVFEKQVHSQNQASESQLAPQKENPTFASKRKKIAEAKKDKKKKKKSNMASIPSQQQLTSLFEHYQNRRFNDAEKLAVSITNEFPKHQFGWKILGAVLGVKGKKSEAVDANQTAVALSPQDAKAHSNLGNTLRALGRLDEAEASYTQAITLKPDYAEAQSNLGNTLKQLDRFDEALASYKQAVALKPDYAKAHGNLGITLKELGRLDEAEASYTQAIALKPDYAEAHSNLGNTLRALGRLDEAVASYTQAIALKPDFTGAYWNLHGIQKNIIDAEHWIDKCLEVDENHVEARLTKAALRFYRGDKSDFYNLMQSELKRHPHMRSFAWAFSLPKLPELHFDKWYFFDAIVKKSIPEKPFYEFGVWRASSFKYLIRVFKKGYGFDTFTGLPEDWDVGNHIEKKGTYTSDGNVPKIKGGEFIVGKFEDTLPVFFSESRPTASLINFDADLYSSTICALNFSKSVMDKDTILIFDEFIINESWEQDEFKALNEFCSINHFSYEVIAISFFTKQAAVKLIGI